MYARIAKRCGYGHSVGLHSFKQRVHPAHGRAAGHQPGSPCASPCAAANGGHATNRMPSTTTLGCGTWGRNSTTENIHYKHFLNITWVNEPVSRPRELQRGRRSGAQFWKKYGK